MGGADCRPDAFPGAAAGFRHICTGVHAAGAGLTALYSLTHAAPLIGRKVLITGASGGVGHLAIQLARRGGAHVVASIRRPEREAVVREVGVGDLATAEASGPYDVVLEAVGAGSLEKSLTLLAPNGSCIIYGVSAGGEVTFNAGQFMTRGGIRLYGFMLFHETLTWPASDGLARLAGFVADKALVRHIAVEEPWERIGLVTQRLLDREIAGQAVLTL